MSRYGGQYSHHQPSKVKLGLLIVGFLAIGLLAVVGWRVYQSSQQVIPADIRSKMNYSVFWPNKNSLAKVDKTTIKYDANEKLLTFVARLKDGNQLIVSEQPTPESLLDVPDSYQKLVEKMQQYKVFETVNGRAYLTRPESLNGGQTAVMNSHGVLLFVRPSKDVATDDWQQIMGNLETLQ